MSTPYSAQTIALAGADAVAFAHAQFSSDVRALAPGRWQFSAWLDAAGRVRALFHLARLQDERLLLLLRGGEAEAVARDLAPYVFRAKVSVAPQPVASLGVGPALPLYRIEADGDGFRVGCGEHSLAIGDAADDRWRGHDIVAGWPWLPPGTGATWLPAALDLSRLGATALDKGCYPGQEIVARMHYRGGNKRHLHRLRCSTPLSPGTLLQDADGRRVQLLDTVPAKDGAIALGIVDDALATELEQGLHITHEGESVTLMDLEDRPLAGATFPSTT